MTSTSERTRHEATLGELLIRLSEQSSALVRSELALAKAELRDEAKHAGIGVGLFGGAGFLSLLGAGSLVTAAIGALALTFPLWVAALVVGAALLALAGVVALVGRSQLASVGPPQRTITSVQRDLEQIKEARG